MGFPLELAAVVLYGVGLMGGLMGYFSIHYAIPMLLPGLVVMAQGMRR